MSVENFKTCATTNGEVTLPTAVVGLAVVVVNNNEVKSLNITPASNDRIGQGDKTTIAAGSSSKFAAWFKHNPNHNTPGGWEEVDQ